ncbi:MAG TPA: RNA polymerase sigma factor [Gaiellaceae bacterium]
MEGRPHDQRELVLRARRGDAHAFAALVQPHEETAFRLAYVIAGNAADAEEAAQEGLIKVWRALGRFRESEPLRPWLLRIVANEARNRKRSTGRRSRLAVRAEVERSSGDAAPSPEDIVSSRDENRRLREALDELPEPARVVLSCRYLLELSESETAAALGVRPGTVKSRTARALDQLRERYE